MADRTAGVWYLIQFTPDLRRREPRNIGVALRGPGGWLTKFFARDGDRINGHRLRGYGLSRDAYETWLDYYDRKIANDSWDDVLRAQERRAGNFRVVKGGEILEAHVDLHAEIERLYGELVTDRPTPSGNESNLKVRVQKILGLAEVNATAGWSTEADYGHEQRAHIKWDFGYQNGRLHLMETMPLIGSWAHLRAQAFNAKAAAVSRAAADENRFNFVCFYEPSAANEAALDDVLRPIDALGVSIPIADEEHAVETVRALMKSG